MIVTWLTGGLGNQMFQYAAGLALAEQHRTVLKLDVSWYRKYPEYGPQNRYSLSCLNVTEQFATREEIDQLRGVQLTRTERWSVRLARLLRFYQYANRYSNGAHPHYSQRFAFYEEFFDQPDNTYISGMWQSERFFAPVSNLVRLHFSFRYPPTTRVVEMATRISQGTSAFMSVRRGDYVTNPIANRDIGVLTAEYYYRAEALLRDKYPDVTLYIFSDDIESVEREYRPLGKHTFVRVTEPWHAYDQMRLMSQCQHGIIANSTFSWWAAWLIPNSEKIVIAPDPWFASKAYDGCDIVPPNWIRLPVNPSLEVRASRSSFTSN
jgi:hypothetical protein